MEIFLIRHTRPDVPAGLIYGHTDVPLHADFAEDRKAVLQNLPPAFEAAYSSPATRCRLLARHLHENVILDERLQEINFGLWEGLTWNTIPPHEQEPWMNDFVNTAPPQGESLLHMNERVQQFWNSLRQQPYQTVAVVTHAGVIRLVMAALKKIPLNKMFSLPVEYGQVFRVVLPPEH